MVSSPEVPSSQALRRRTFAIISHPDAGKTTLTEKLLLYGGALGREAGAVKAKGARRSATSDWMELEQQRGISITSTVLQFPYRDCVVNLLDTPGHRDFSEDTYRVLTACDAAVMVLDAAKGIEAQTQKLFEVCRSRGLPILTYVNKWDRPGLSPLELIDDIESKLGLICTPMTWPVGIAGDFRGVVDRSSGDFIRFTRTARGRSSSWRCWLRRPCSWRLRDFGRARCCVRRWLGNCGCAKHRCGRQRRDGAAWGGIWVRIGGCWQGLGLIGASDLCLIRHW